MIIQRGLTMETVLLQLISKLDANSVLLLVILYGGWKLVSQFLGVFNTHGAKVAESLELIQKDISDLKTNVIVIAHKVESHDERISRLEEK
jgi:hypothetical protein